MKRHGLATLLALSLAGCAANPAQAPNSPATPSRAQASAKIHTELAALYYERAQYAVALEELDYALAAEPGYAPAYNVRGLVQMALHEDALADADFQRSLQLDGNDSETHNNYGWFLCQHGKPRESIAQFMAALKNPLYATPGKASLNAGMCARKSADDAAAEQYFQRALELQPDLAGAYWELAQLAFDRGDWVGAKWQFVRFERAVNAPLQAPQLWLAFRIERALGRQGNPEPYAAQLRNRFPDARETQTLLYGAP